MTNVTTGYDFTDRTLRDRDGDKIGTIDELYLDQRDRPARMGAGAHRPVRHPQDLRPARASAQPDGEDVRVPNEKAQVKDAPNVEPDGAALHDEESRAVPSTTACRTRRGLDDRGPARRARRDRRRAPLRAHGRGARARHRRPRRLRPEHRRRDDALRGGDARRHHPPSRPAARGCASTSSPRSHADRPRPARGGPRRARADHRRQPRRRADGPANHRGGARGHRCTPRSRSSRSGPSRRSACASRRTRDRGARGLRRGAQGAHRHRRRGHPVGRRAGPQRCGAVPRPGGRARARPAQSGSGQG